MTDETTARDDGTPAPTYDPEGAALHLLRGTQAAARACLPWVGRGDKEAADQAAVEAMRKTLADVPGRGRVVIGEGEKDNAPMLYTGEELGAGDELTFEIAVDPLEGTTYCAQGLEGAIAVVSAAPPGALWGAKAAFYMDKLVVGPGAAGAIDIDASPEDNLANVAEALGKEVRDLAVVILDKPRHEGLIERVRKLGCAVIAISDGDVMGSLRALVPHGKADLAMGVGGAPEGVITACATRLLGGDMQARPAPQSDDERSEMEKEGIDLDGVLHLDDLVGSGDCAFIATGVTTSALLPGPESTPWGVRVRSILVTPKHKGVVVEGLLAEPEGAPGGRP
ncbi:MAG TPA: class II fructose-bisphosphatase [Acidimicrobiales bacterium]|nr:class II fructose-bisphosphatase [Acidimicrobiales bacterium]